MRRTLVLLKDKDDDAIQWYRQAKACIEARSKARDSLKLDWNDRERSKSKPKETTMTIGGRTQQHFVAVESAADQKLTFGKHSGKALKEVPLAYLRWMARGFVGKFGRLARLALEEMGTSMGDIEDHGQDDVEAELVASLKECWTLALAQEVRSKLDSSGSRFKQQLYLQNLLLLAYGRCGAWEEAQGLFKKMATRNKYTWNTMFKVCCDNGRWSEADEMFKAMGSLADPKTCTIMIHYFSNAGHLQQAAAAFARIEERDVDAAAWNALTSCYAQHGYIEKTMQCFQQMQGKRSVVAWNALLTAHTQMSGDCKEACEIFMKMPHWDSISSTSIIIVCGNHGNVEFTEKVFRAMAERDITSWTVAGVAFARSGDFNRTSELLKKMPMADVLTWNTVLAAYGSWELAMVPLRFQEMPCRDAVSWTVMVAAFAKKRELLEAERYIMKAPAWNLQMWNALLAGFSRNGKVEEALKYLSLMNIEG